jgi:hypothetical protein
MAFFIDIDQTQTAASQVTVAPQAGAAPGAAPQTRAEICLTNQDALQGAQASLRALQRALESVQSERYTVVQRLRQGGAAEGADLTGLQDRVKTLDAQIAQLDTKIFEAQNAVVTASAAPCAFAPPPPRTGPPDGVFAMGGMFIAFVLFPIAIAYSRRVWRRGAKLVMGVSGEMGERLNRLEESVDAVAIEVERIGEGQRFVTNLFIDGGAPQMLNTGSVDAASARPREGVEIERRG